MAERSSQISSFLFEPALSFCAQAVFTCKLPLKTVTNTSLHSIDPQPVLPMRGSKNFPILRKKALKSARFVSKMGLLSIIRFERAEDAMGALPVVFQPHQPRLSAFNRKATASRICNSTSTLIRTSRLAQGGGAVPNTPKDRRDIRRTAIADAFTCQGCAVRVPADPLFLKLVDERAENVHVQLLILKIYFSGR